MKMEISLKFVSTVFAVVIASFATPVFANEDLGKRKAEASAEIDERIQKLQEHKACINAAATIDAIKQCRASMKEWRKSERIERLEERKGRIDERMKKIQEKN